MTAYIIKSSLSLIIMFGLYWVLLRKEKLFRFNRFFLIFSILFSLAIPFITVPVNVQNNKAERSIIYAINENIPSVNSEPETVTNLVAENENAYQPITQKTEFPVVAGPAISFNKAISLLYFIIAVLLFLRFLRNLIFISKQKKSSESIQYSGQRVVLVESQINPYCFINAIYVNKHDFLEKRIDNELLNHEVQHIKQAHSIDIIFMELIQILYWFNPVLILYNKAVRVNHEYLADNAVLDTSQNVKSYADILLNFISCRRNIPLTSGFNQSLTRKRLNMMIKPKSKGIFSGLRIIITSLLIFIVFAFLSFKQVSSDPSKLVFIPYPVNDTVKILESGIISRYPTYSDGFYISHEITNKEYREFTAWLKNNPDETILQINDTSTIIKAAKTGETREIVFHLPKQIAASEIINECMVSKNPYKPGNEYKNYFFDERFDNYPVVGVSRKMAEYYCLWRTKSETIITYDTTGGRNISYSKNDFTYRLPTENEWDFVAQKYTFKQNKGSVKNEIQRADETGTIEYGILHLNDNVSEWVTSSESSKFIAKGGSWKSENDITMKQVFNKDNEDETIGFRIVKSQRPKKSVRDNSHTVKDIDGNIYKRSAESELTGQKAKPSSSDVIENGEEQPAADFSGKWKYNNSKSTLIVEKEIGLSRIMTIIQNTDSIIIISNTSIPDRAPLSNRQSYKPDGKRVITKYGVDEEKTQTVSTEWLPGMQSFSITTTLNYLKEGEMVESKRIETYSLSHDGKVLTVYYNDNNPERTFTSVKEDDKFYMVYDKIESEKPVSEEPLTPKFTSFPVVASFAGKTNGKLRKSEIENTYKLEARVQDPDPDLKYKITSFTFMITRDKTYITLTTEGNTLTEEMKSYLAQMSSGQRAMFKDIKALGPDGNTIDLGAIILAIE